MTLVEYVIAFRTDRQGDRAADLAAVIRHLAPLEDTAVVVVEQDVEPRWEPDPRVRHVFLRHEGPFNKSWAMNVGFRRTKAPVLAFGDADLLMPIADIETAIAGIRAGFDAVNPFDRLVDLSPPQTADVWRGEPMPPAPPDLPDARRADGEYLPFCGGLFLIDRDAFLRAGGYDERFSGWGGEDDALSVKLARMGLRCGVAQGRVAFHLWHERPPSRYTRVGYAQNVARLRHLQECPPEELAELCAADALRIGDEKAPIAGPLP